MPDHPFCLSSSSRAVDGELRSLSSNEEREADLRRLVRAHRDEFENYVA